jgi:hypothetical protein
MDEEGLDLHWWVQFVLGQNIIAIASYRYQPFGIFPGMPLFTQNWDFALLTKPN